jgi:hypothetical protein
VSSGLQPQVVQALAFDQKGREARRRVEDRGLKDPSAPPAGCMP